MRVLRQPRPLPSADASTDPLDLWLADPLAASRAFARVEFLAAPAPPVTCLAPSPLDSAAAPVLLAAPPRPAPPRAAPAALPEPLPTIAVSLPAPSAAETAACAPLPAWPACDDHGLMVAPVPWLTAHLPMCASWPVAAAAAEQGNRDAMDVDAENEDEDDEDDDAAPRDRCARVRLPTPPPLHIASRAPSPAAAAATAAERKDTPGRRRRMRGPPTAPSTP